RPSPPILSELDLFGLSRPVIPGHPSFCHPLPANWVAKSVADLALSTRGPSSSPFTALAKVGGPTSKARNAQSSGFANEQHSSSWSRFQPKLEWKARLGNPI